MPTYYLAPDPCQSTFFIPGSNTPGNGVKVFTYATGTTTKVSVAKDVSGSALHTNPIILDSGGNLPSASSMYIEAGVEIDVVYAPSSDTDPPASAYKTISNVLGVPPQNTSTSQWVDVSSPVFVNTNAFRVSGDQTTELHVGRRIKTTNTGGTVYSRVTSTAFGTSTTVGVVNDSGSLDSGLSTAAYGLLSADNPSTPLLTEFYPIVRASTSPYHALSFNLQNMVSSMAVDASVLGLVSSFVVTTWTPTILNATVASYNTQNGVAIKVNNLVWFNCTISGNVSSQSGNFLGITGLPYNATTGINQAASVGFWGSAAESTYAIAAYVQSANPNILLSVQTSAAVGAGNGSGFFRGSGSNSNITITGIYQCG